MNNIQYTKGWAATKIKVFIFCLYRGTMNPNSVGNIYVVWSEKILVTFDYHHLRFYKSS